ncbi:hypothetical protein [Andreprevotia chitinilytica]|uniref:hypothetical protein n=1 Tax=Andreprevotia chitinilytica TaxID=396808 RepID=UPI00054F0257|nr:hypothetical protein [Andreprevotia chitinilytica]
MTLENLSNLLKTGSLKSERASAGEFAGLLRSAIVRLQDAKNSSLSQDSRFDLAYNASHALALAALRYHGYRSDNRYLVFQCLPHTLDAGPEIWRVLAKCHQQRNLAEYEGYLEIDERLLAELIIAADWLLDKVQRLPPLVSPDPSPSST